MMGKEQELLDAARSGNLALVEKILSHRVKKSGPLASLRRCPGPNTQDSCGYTCLHHAALNGHKDIVELLLSHDANPNIVDNKGSTALHLAAWTGDYEIVNMLLTQSSHVPNVNLKNNDYETALHCAAQYGHTSVVSLLLQKGSDPMCRNVKDESALDLAAQYGRADTVELFLRTRPSLVRHLTAKHSPLHLASRNGHKNVVKMLIDAKFDVNYCTETGSALHEAALFGKIEVVKLLLNSGVDIELEDCQKRTVLDLLNDLNTVIAKQTKKLIREHSTLVNTDLDDSSTLMSDSSSHCISPPPGYTDNTPEHHYNDQTLTDGIASPAMTSASEFSFYEAPPQARLSVRSSTGSEDYRPNKTRLSRSRDSMLDGYSTSSSRSPSYLDYEIPPPLPPRHFSNRDSQTSDSNPNNLYEIPPIPIAINPNEDYVRSNVISYELEMRPESQSSVCSSHSGYGRIGDKPMPPVKPPRKSISPVNRSLTCNSYDYNHQSGYDNTLNRNANNDRNCDISSANKRHTPDHALNQFCTFKGDSRRRLIEETDFSLLYDQIANGSAVNSSSLNRPAIRAPHFSSHTRSKSEHHPKYFEISDNLSPNSAKSNSNMKTKRATVQIPINSDNNNQYNGQTTPDYEPPSPTTAANGIQAVIHPLSLSDRTNSSDDDSQSANHYNYCTSEPNYLNCSHNSNNNTSNDDCDDEPIFYSIPTLEYKKLCSKPSRDIETLTEEELFATLDSSGYVRLSFRKSLNDNKNKVVKKTVAVSTDNQIPVIVNNNNSRKCNNRNIYNNYCETLKLDRSGEKENPFAGLCRGSVVSNSSVKRREVTDGRKSLRRQRNFNCDNNIYSTLKRNKNKKSKSMDTSDKSRTRNVKNTTVDDCLGVATNKSGHEDRKSDISGLSGSPFDENAEWAEIANIMASFGSGIGRESLFNSEMDNSFTSYLSKDSSSTDIEDQTVEEWLTRIGLSEYANLLIVNGFDNVLFMGSNVMDDSDLLEIGVTNASHRDKILLEAKTLPKVKLLTKSDEILTVDEWLESLKLTEYRNSFKNNGYNEMSRVRNLWEVELNTVLEINKLGHRKRILASLGERLRLIEDLGLDDLDFDKLNLNISQLSVEEPLNNSLKENDKKADESGPQRNSMTNPQLASDGDKVTANQSTTQWKHTNKELIDGSCKYTANYLGSTLVRELRGIDSTRASIQKLKLSTKSISKIPKVILSISYTGVQFIDAQTQQMVCEHEIRNIHCICQDSEDLNHFAYITKELETNNHYCHVFSAQNTDLVTEVILTLGQAFEIAYQMVLESDKCPKDMTENAPKNNVVENKPNNSMNLNSLQIKNSEIKINSNHNKEVTNRKDHNNKENVKQTYITTINITTSDQNSYSKVGEKVEKVCKIDAQTGQSSSNSIANEEPKRSKPSTNTSSTVTTPATTQTKPTPPSGKPSPPVIARSGQRPTPSPKPTTIPKPATKAKPVLPFKPQILAKPSNK